MSSAEDIDNLEDRRFRGPCNLHDMYADIAKYRKEDVYACYPYLASPPSDPTPPAVFAATVDNVRDSFQVRTGKMRMLSDIVEDFSSVVQGGATSEEEITRRIRIVGPALWLRRGPAAPRFMQLQLAATQEEPPPPHLECNVFEELLHQREPPASAKMLTDVMVFAPVPVVPRALLRPVEQKLLDEGEDEFHVTEGGSSSSSSSTTARPLPLLFVVLVVHCVTVLRKEHAFHEMENCLKMCLKRTSMKDRAGSLVNARVGARAQTLFSFCCMWGQPEYAMFVLREAVPPQLHDDYLCVVDDTQNTAEMYARERGLTAVVNYLEKIGLQCDGAAATPFSAGPNVETATGRAHRKRRHEELVTSALQKRIRADIEDADTDDMDDATKKTQQQHQELVKKVIDSDDPDEVHVRLWRRSSSSSLPSSFFWNTNHRQMVETVSVSRASFSKLLLNAPKWVECAYLPDTAPLRKGGRRALDVERIRRNAKFYHTLAALGFDPDGHGRTTLVRDLDLVNQMVSWTTTSSASAASASSLVPKYVVDLEFVDGDDAVVVDSDSEEDDANRTPATMEAVPYSHIETLPLPHARAAANGRLDTSSLADPFQALVPEEHRALVKYHHQHDEMLNGMLRAQSPDRPDVDDDPDLASTNPFFQSDLFRQKWRRLGPTVAAAIANIRSTQQAIDRAFRNVRPLDRPIIVYRGIRYLSPAAAEADRTGQPMPTGYQALTAGLNQSRKVGLQRGYTSTSASQETAVKFVYEDPCCVQRIQLPAGLPVLFVEKVAAEHQKEMEVLLPRGVELVIQPRRRGSVARTNGSPPIPVVHVEAVLSPEGRAVLERHHHGSDSTTTTGSSRQRRANDYGDEPKCTLFRLATVLLRT